MTSFNTMFNVPQNTPNYTTGGNYGNNLFSSLAGASNQYLKQNPEKFSIMADAIGRNLAPQNPFAGIGTAMGQSSLANKAAEATKNKMSMIEQFIAGMTKKGIPGGNDIKIAQGPDGGLVVTTNSDLASDENKTQTPTDGPPTGQSMMPAETETMNPYSALDKYRVQ